MHFLLNGIVAMIPLPRIDAMSLNEIGNFDSLTFVLYRFMLFLPIADYTFSTRDPNPYIGARLCQQKGNTQNSVPFHRKLSI